jgi:hypothetical protein
MAEETQVSCGFQQKVDTTCKQLSNCAIPARHRALHPLPKLKPILDLNTILLFTLWLI